MTESKPKAEGDPKPRPRLVLPAGQDVVYSNVVRIMHSPSEMVFDFGRAMPGEPDVHIKSRVLMAPLSAKLLQKALADNIAKYESIFGEIKLPQGKSLADDLFRNMPADPSKPDGQA